MDKTIIIVNTLLHCIALYSTRPYISLLATNYSANTMQVGLILSMYSIIQVFCSLLICRVIEIKGVRIPAVFGSAVFLIACLGFTFANNLILITFFTLLLGLGHSSILISSQYITTSIEDSNERYKVVGYYSFVSSMGFFIGPLLGGVLHDYVGVNRAFLGPTFASLLCFLNFLRLPKQFGSHIQRNPYNPIMLLKDKIILRNIIISGTVFFAVDVINSYLPLYGVDIGLTATSIGLIMGVNGIAQMIVRPFLGTISVRITKDRTFLFCLLFGGLAVMGIGISRSFWALLIVGSFAGITIGLANPLTLINVSEIATDDTRSQVLALRVMGNYIGQTVSPILFGALASATGGLFSIFLASGLVMIFCAFSQQDKKVKSV